MNKNITPVNDMILTDKGVFSTDPRDTIMAMKNPASLMGGNVVVNVNNTMADSANVDVQEQTNEEGLKELVVTISKKVASDFATGRNGWDNAYLAKLSTVQGRSVQ